MWKLMVSSLGPCDVMQTFQGLQWKECLVLLCRIYSNMAYEAELYNYSFTFDLSFCLFHTKWPCFRQYSAFAALSLAFLCLWISRGIYMCVLIITILDSDALYQPSVQNSHDFFNLPASTQCDKEQLLQQE